MEELQKFVGGYFELLRFQEKADNSIVSIAVLNDEAAMHHMLLPYNTLASERIGMKVYGDVLICTEDELKNPPDEEE